VGAKPEPFLRAMLGSIANVADALFVNENSALGSAASNLPALESSRFAKEERMYLDRSPFRDFASARNACIALDSAADDNTWIMFIDGDEVHWPRLGRIAAQLEGLPRTIQFVDGFTWHFFRSFDWYGSIERRMMFFRWSPQLRWEGVVHERLRGPHGRRVALPYVYAHYGYVMPFAEDARKGAQYAAFGAHGTPLTSEQARAADEHRDYKAVDAFYADRWANLLRFHGSHPPAAAPYIEQQKAAQEEHFAAIDALVRRHQRPAQRLKNALRAVNYEQRWRLRILDAARYGML